MGAAASIDPSKRAEKVLENVMALISVSVSKFVPVKDQKLVQHQGGVESHNLPDVRPMLAMEFRASGSIVVFLNGS